MNRGQIRDRVRALARIRDANNNADSILNDIIQQAYEDLWSDLIAEDPDLGLADPYDLVLTSLYTDLPSSVGHVVRVSDQTGLASTVEGQPLAEIHPSEAQSTTRVGFSIQARTIRPVNFGWDGTTLRLWYVSRVETLSADSSEPALIFPENHRAIVWRAVEITQTRNGEPTQAVMRESYKAKTQMLVNMMRWQGSNVGLR